MQQRQKYGFASESTGLLRLANRTISRQGMVTWASIFCPTLCYKKIKAGKKLVDSHRGKHASQTKRRV